MATQLALLDIDGVLAEESQNMGDAKPIDAGIKLYHALTQYFHVGLFTHRSDEEAVKHWLKVMNLKKHDELKLRRSGDAVDPAEFHAAAINHFRGNGYSVELLITASPVGSAITMKMGVLALLFAHPKYLRPEFRPDRDMAVKPWDEISAEIERQKVLKEADTR